MPRAYVTLAEYPMDMVRLACTNANAAASTARRRCSSATAPTPTWSPCGLEVAADCPKVIANKIMDLCGVYYADRIG